MSAKPVTIRIAGVVRESIVDGPGIRFVVFAQGCPHRCEACHNQATHDFSGGYDCETEKIVEEIEKNPLLAGVTFSGGEPFAQPAGFLDLAQKLKEKNINILAFTGYTYEELEDIARKNESVGELLRNLDVLIDGRFIFEKRDLTLKFRGSSNQRIIDLAATRERGEIVELE